jgi:hypothetical protein
LIRTCLSSSKRLEYALEIIYFGVMMKKVKGPAKVSPVSNLKNLKVEINQLIEKGLKKVIKRIDSLEKTVEKLKAAKQKPAKRDSAKKVKAPAKVKVKKTRRSKKPKAVQS